MFYQENICRAHSVYPLWFLTLTEHMPQSHRVHAEDSERMKRWANKMDL